LGLTKDQSDKIERIFAATIPDLSALQEDFDRRDDRLSKLIGRDAPKTEIAQQIDRVEAKRSELNKARALMLVDMRHELTAQQRGKFETLHAAWETERLLYQETHPQNPNWNGRSQGQGRSNGTPGSKPETTPKPDSHTGR